jgi:hypothetical protein
MTAGTYYAGRSETRFAVTTRCSEGFSALACLADELNRHRGHNLHIGLVVRLNLIPDLNENTAIKGSTRPNTKENVLLL